MSLFRSNSSLEISARSRPDFGSSLSINSEPKPKFRFFTRKARACDDLLRHKSIHHHDVVSIGATFARAPLTRRRNTTTGASAASTNGDSGDGRSNACVASCPFFRNEIGAECERRIFASRTSTNTATSHPLTSITLCDEQWNEQQCVLVRPARVERDDGAAFYRRYFFGFEHQNWIGVDPNLGPCACSIRRERDKYRIIVRTCDMRPLRGTVFEQSLPAPHVHHHPHNHHAREVLEWACPEISVACLRLALPSADDQLLRLDEQSVTRQYKIGVIYCASRQRTEEEMYNNEKSSPAFEEFLNVIGERVRLKGFTRYRGGLDTRSDTTGTHSVYAAIDDCEIMFHVSTLLPFTRNNRQQLLRKRHIGNDIVTIVFQEHDAYPFSASHVRSHFQHVFIIVRHEHRRRYRVAVSRCASVPHFGPLLPRGGVFTCDEHFVRFLLLKAINGENAAHTSDKFASMAQRTRHEYLKDLAQNHVTNTTIDATPSCASTASRLASLFRRPPQHAPQFYPNGTCGGVVWSMAVEDLNSQKTIDAFVALSPTTLLVIERGSHETIFAVATRAIIAWNSPSLNLLRVYFHCGECLILRSINNNEISEIVERLRSTTQGEESKTILLSRDLKGHLGFHINSDAIVTDIEAHLIGLNIGARLLEVCHVNCACISHNECVDLLKTSQTVSITVVNNARACTACSRANNNDDVITVSAQPAHVLPSILDHDHRLIDNRLIDNIDWPSLVDTATRATMEPNYYELEERVTRLTRDLRTEQTQKDALELTVQRLREENKRLHHESQTAASQLRKFTEWYWTRFK